IVAAPPPGRPPRAWRRAAIHRLSDRRAESARRAQAVAIAVPVERIRSGNAAALFAAAGRANHSRQLDLRRAARDRQPGDRPGPAGLRHRLRPAPDRRPGPADPAGDLRPGRLAGVWRDFVAARLDRRRGDRRRPGARPAAAAGLARAGRAAQLSAMESPSPLEKLRRKLALAVGEKAVFDGWTKK